MSQGIVITGQVLGAERVTARLTGAPGRVLGRVRGEVQRLGFDLLRKVKAEKLTGQALRVRTGRLRRSINMRMREANGEITTSVGTNVSYGRFWELGFKGVQQVRQHLRTIKQVFGRPDAPTQVQVGAHSRNVSQEARPFLQPSLAEMKGEIRSRLLVAVHGGI